MRCIFSRMNGLGLCSGIGRLGAIMGIILGEYKWLHLSTPVKIVAGKVFLFSSKYIHIQEFPVSWGLIPK